MGRTRAEKPEPGDDLRVRLREAEAGVQELGPHQAQGQIAVTEAKPRVAAGPGEPVHHRPGVVADPVAALVEHGGERVGDQVGVG
jgi:hypothetical protein